MLIVKVWEILLILAVYFGLQFVYTWGGRYLLLRLIKKAFDEKTGGVSVVREELTGTVRKDGV